MGRAYLRAIMATTVAMAAAMAISDGERALGTWSRAASQAPAPAGADPTRAPRGLRGRPPAGSDAAVPLLAVTAADPGDLARVGGGALGHREPCSTELRAGHGRAHLRRAELGGAASSSHTGRVADAVALSLTPRSPASLARAVGEKREREGGRK